jgi:hypothetical protein
MIRQSVLRSSEKIMLKQKIWQAPLHTLGHHGQPRIAPIPDTPHA